MRNVLREDRIDLAAARLIDVPALDLLQRVELLGRRAPPESNRRSLVENPSYGERAPRHQAREMAEYYLTVPFPSRLTRSRRVISSKGTGRLMR